MNDKNPIIKTEKTISLALWKAVGILLFAVIGSAGAGLWGAVVTLNSDHYTVMALAKDVESIEKNYMPLDLSQEKWKNNDYQHAEIIRRLDVIQTTLSRLK